MEWVQREQQGKRTPNHNRRLTLRYQYLNFLQKKVLNFSIGLLQDEDDNPFKPVTKEEILAELDASEGDIRAGRTKDAHQAMSDIKVRLGMPL